MSEKIEIYLHRKGDLRKNWLPEEWTDPEKITVMPAYQRQMALGNPLSKSDDDPVRAYVVVDNRVAGRVCLIMGELSVAGQAVPVLWGYDLLVSTQYRGRGLAIKLIKAWQDGNHTTMGMHVNLQSVGIYRKFSWGEQHTPTYTTVKRSRKFVDVFTGSSALGALLSPLVDIGLALRRAAGSMFSGGGVKGLRVEAVPEMSEEFDQQLSRYDTTVATHRSAAWINWALEAGAADKRRVYRLYYVRDTGGAVVGYFLVQLNPQALLRGRFKDVRLGLLKDWGIFDEQKASLLEICLLASKELVQLGAEAVHVTVPDKATGQALLKRGYRPAQPLITVFHAYPDSPIVGEEYKNQEIWRYTAAEADGFFV